MEDVDFVMFNKFSLILRKKLTETFNYNIWAGAIKMWLQGQVFEDHLTIQSKDITTVKHVKWKQNVSSLCSMLWFFIAPNIQVHLQVQYHAFTTCYEVW